MKEGDDVTVATLEASEGRRRSARSVNSLFVSLFDEKSHRSTSVDYRKWIEKGNFRSWGWTFVFLLFFLLAAFVLRCTSTVSQLAAEFDK